MRVNRREKQGRSLNFQSPSSDKNQEDSKTFLYFFHLDENISNAVTVNQSTREILRLFKKNWRTVLSTSQTQKNLALALFKAVQHLSETNNNSDQNHHKIQNQCFNYILENLEQWEKAFHAIQTSNQNQCLSLNQITAAYSTLALPLPDTIKDMYISYLSDSEETKEDGKKRATLHGIKVQYLLTQNPEYEEIAKLYAAQFAPETPEENYALYDTYLLFNWDTSKYPHTIPEPPENKVSKTEEMFAKRLWRCGYTVKKSAPLTSGFSHITDFELETEDEDIRFLIEVDSHYHQAGTNENGLERLNGSTLLRSHLIMQEARKHTHHVILLRTAESANNLLYPLNDADFKSALAQIIENTAQHINEPCILHAQNGEFFITPITDQYAHFRIEQPSAQPHHHQANAHENEELLAPH